MYGTGYGKEGLAIFGVRGDGETDSVKGETHRIKSRVVRMEDREMVKTERRWPLDGDTRVRREGGRKGRRDDGDCSDERKFVKTRDVWEWNRVPQMNVCRCGVLERRTWDILEDGYVERGK